MDEFLTISENAVGTVGTTAYGPDAICSLKEVVSTSYLGDELVYDTLEADITQQIIFNPVDEGYVEGNGSKSASRLPGTIRADGYIGFDIEFSISPEERDHGTWILLGAGSAGLYIDSDGTSGKVYVNDGLNYISITNMSVGYDVKHILSVRGDENGTYITFDGNSSTYQNVQSIGSGRYTFTAFAGVNNYKDRVYNIKLYKNGELVMNVIPEKNMDGVIKWKDQVSGGSSGGLNGDLVGVVSGESIVEYGPEVKAFPYTGQVLRYIGGIGYSGINSVYYINTSKQIGKKMYEYYCMSAIGILDKQDFAGGLYSGTTLRNVIKSILGTYDYSGDTWCVSTYYTTGISDILVYGWIPYCTKREALQQICFAYMLQIKREFAFHDGDTYATLFTFERINQYKSTTQIPDDSIFIGGSEESEQLTTSIELTEHSFYAYSGTSDVLLFDNTSGSPADKLLVKFPQAPIRVDTIVRTGSIVFDAVGVNYAIVTGQGTISGKPYTHVTSVITRTSDNADRAENIVKVTNATLVTAVNSESVADRLADYYFNRYVVKADIVYNGESTGRLYDFNNQFGIARTGYLRKMEKTISSFTKAKCEFLCGVDFGTEDTSFTNYALITSNSSWVVPENITRIRAVLIGGGDGGSSGIKGKGNSGTSGGAGGRGGSGGAGGKVLVVTLDVVAGISISIGIGSGGAGADVNTSDTASGSGASGSNTTLSYTMDSILSSFTSANGTTRPNGIANQFTGDVYATPGVIGTSGGKGGNSATWDKQGGFPNAESGENVSGGLGGKGGDWVGYTIQSGKTFIGYCATGGGGGGAAVNTNGNAGDDGHRRNTSTTEYWAGGKGGNGASPLKAADSTVYGAGGNGGHGGGGGGGNGAVSGTGKVNIDPNYAGQRSYGGNGGAAGNGAAGCVLIYY